MFRYEYFIPVMSTFKVVLIGNSDAIKNSLFSNYRYQFGKKALNFLSFATFGFRLLMFTASPTSSQFPKLKYFDSPPRRIEVDGQIYKLEIYNATDWEKFYHQWMIDKHIDAFILIYSVVEPHTYNHLLKFEVQQILRDFPFIPIVLVGNKKDFRNNTEILAKPGKHSISTKMGKKLARVINAMKHVESSSFDIQDLAKIFKEIVGACLRNRITMRSISITAVGARDSGKTEIIRRFVSTKRFNVLEECLNEKLNYDNNYDDYYSTFVTIDGEDFQLRILDVSVSKTNNISKPSKKESLVFELSNDSIKVPNSKQKDPVPSFWYRNDDVVLFVFSVVEPESFNAISNDLFLEMQRYNWPESTPLTMLVGNQTSLRNDTETLKNLSKQGKQPISYEMGKQLAREIGAVKYLECSSSDGTGIENVFEELVWASLRRFEEERRKFVKNRRILPIFTRL